MPRREPDHFADLPFPDKGLDVSGPVNAQPSLTTPSGQNCRAYQPGTNRRRGASRPGLGRYINARVNGINLIQDINTVISTDEAAVGTGGGFQPTVLSLGTLLVQGPAQGQAQLLDGFGDVLYTSPSVSSFSEVCVVFDSSGNGYIIAAKTGVGVTVTSVDSSGVERWTGGFDMSPSRTLIHGAQVDNGTLYILHSGSANTAFVGSINATTGATVNEQLFRVTPADNTFRLVIADSLKRMAISSGLLAVSGQKVGTGTQASTRIWSLTTNLQVAEFLIGDGASSGTGSGSVSNVVTDGAGNFAVTGLWFRGGAFNFGIAECNSAGVPVWENSVTTPVDGTSDLVYDPTGARYVLTGSNLLGSATGNVVTLNPSTGLEVLRATVTDGGRNIALGPGGSFRFATTTSVSNVPSDLGTATFTTAITSSGTSLAGVS